MNNNKAKGIPAGILLDFLNAIHDHGCQLAGPEANSLVLRFHALQQVPQKEIHKGVEGCSIVLRVLLGIFWPYCTLDLDGHQVAPTVAKEVVEWVGL